MNIFIELIVGFVGIVIGFYTGVKWVFYQTKKVSDDIKKGIEKIFIDIKSNIKTMTFKQRIHQFSHFNLGKYTIVYIMDKKEIAIFEEETCVAISNQLDSKIPNDIIKFIDEHFTKEINDDVINVQGYIVSKNFIKKMEEPSDISKIIESNKTKYSLDDILDKISSNGINKLTKEEQEFLKGYSNGDR